jgi:pantoate--beta-alanine ligase
MYPPGFQTHVEPGALAERLEGAHRPGHFRGVTTVVTKLFGAVRPDLAVFGQKDAQQLAIVRRMTTDLDLGVEIVGLATVREPDGVAMSSRNRRLDAHQRNAAACIPRALRAAERLVHLGETDTRRLADEVASVVGDEPLARLEHVEIVDPDTLDPVGRIDGEALVLTAVWFGDVRLIDNLLVAPR